MATVLKQSTEIKVRVGPFVDASDAVTPETGVTLGAADQAELLKGNGAATVDISGATWAAVTGSDGWYDLTLTTSHTDTVGELVIVVQDASVCLPVFARFQVVEEAVYVALFAASAPGYVANQPVDVNTIKTQAVICEAGVTVGAYVGGTGAAALETTAQTIVADTNELQTDWANGGRLDLIVDELTTNVDAVETDTQDIQSRIPAALTGDGNIKADALKLNGASPDLYHADIQFTRDQANTKDEYTVTWFKNGVRQSSGITSPTLQVIKRADGTDLIASSAMTEIGSSGSYKYDASGAERITVGEGVIALVGGTIDGSGRTFTKVLGRDSS